MRPRGDLSIRHPITLLAGSGMVCVLLAMTAAGWFASPESSPAARTAAIAVVGAIAAGLALVVISLAVKRMLSGPASHLTQLEHSQARLAAQNAAMQVLSETQSLAAASPRILQAICENLGWDFGAVWRVEETTDTLCCVETWHSPEAKIPKFEARTRQATFTRGTGLPGRVWSSRQPAWIADVTRDANFPRAPIAGEEGLHGAFGFPILVGDEVRGVMEFFNREIHEPDAELLGTMASIGGQIGQFIERTRAEAAVEHERDLLHGCPDRRRVDLVAVRPRPDLGVPFPHRDEHAPVDLPRRHARFEQDVRDIRRPDARLDEVDRFERKHLGAALDDEAAAYRVDAGVGRREPRGDRELELHDVARGECTTHGRVAGPDLGLLRRLRRRAGGIRGFRGASGIRGAPHDEPRRLRPRGNPE